MNRSDETEPGDRMKLLRVSREIRESVVQEFRKLFSVSEERKGAVLEEIVEGSSPGVRYYLLLSIATLIAALGLVTNSPAVIIGAMLISPLMTPIFGVALGLMRGDMSLLRRALIGEFSGVALAIIAGAVLGFLPFYFKVTPEMLGRTAPTILDLGVAVLAGAAGCLAMIDERISPVLPGIAIATSLVPPLATSGLCLALGAPYGAWGAFLLFFANFLAILIVSSLLFLFAGFVVKSELGSGLSLLRRLSSVIIGLLLVAVLLTRTLLGLIDRMQTMDTIESVIKKEIATEPATTLREVKFKKAEGSIDVLANLRSSHSLKPKKIRAMEDRIGQKLGLKAKLIVRSSIVTDVSATGSTSAIVDENLDGKFITDDLASEVKRLQLAEQVIREVLDQHTGISLRDIELIPVENIPVVVATVESPDPIIGFQAGIVEDLIRKRLEDPKVRLVVRSLQVVDMTRKGRILYGAAHFNDLPPEQRAVEDRIEQATRDHIEKIKDLYAINVDVVPRKEGWEVRAEVVGARLMSPQEVAGIEKELSKVASKPVSFQVWSRVEMLVTDDRYRPLRENLQSTQ